MLDLMKGRRVRKEGAFSPTLPRLLALVAAGLSILIVPAAAEGKGLDRKLELVTPPGAVADIQIASTASTPDGNMVCFSSEDPMAGSPTNGNKVTLDGFCARRGDDGWVTRWETWGYPDTLTGTSGSEVWAVSPDGKKVLFTSDMNIFPDWHRTSGQGKGGNDSTYLREGDSLRWLAPAPPDSALWGPESGSHWDEMSGGANIARGPVAHTEDLEYGVFESNLRILPDVDTNDSTDVYKWSPDGIELVSKDPDGMAMGGRPPLMDFQDMQSPPGTISADGRRLFFERKNGMAGINRPEAPANVYSIYMHEDGEVTPLPIRKGGDTPADVRFEAGTPDGNTIYVTTTEQLTAEPKQPGKAIYRYDVDEDETELVATNALGAEFLGASKDGSTIVYRALLSLRVVRNGTETVLGNIGATDIVWIYGMVGNTQRDKRALRISDDGKVVVFASTGSFTEPNPDAFAQVYRWSPDDGLERISAPSDDGPATGHSSIGNYGTLIPTLSGARYKPFAPIRNGATLGASMTADGSRIFFESDQRLDDRDVNDVIDVYEWHDGEVSLVTPGTQHQHALYHDNSADGKTVFFTTRSALIPELDRNSVRDVYAMRVGGGFPIPKEERCAGEACQGEIDTSAPDAAVSGSARLSGDGNVKAERGKIVRLRAKAPRRVRGAAVTLRVNVSAPGRIAVAGQHVKAVKRGARKAGAQRITVRLKLAAKRALKRRGALATRIRVRFRPREGTARTRSVAVRFQTKKGGR